MATDVVPAADSETSVESGTTPRPRERASAVRQSRSALVALVLVLLFGAYSRLVDLGAADLWSDELFHVLAAESLERGDGPRLPSGELYMRGMDLTRLVRVARHYVSDAEEAARLPSALFGIAGLLTFAAIAWRLAGRWAAVWSTLLLAVFPVVLQEARNTRFYTLQLVHGLVAFYAGWRALEPRRTSPEHDPDRRDGVLGRWGWVALAMLAFLSAARVQLTTVSIVVGWGVAVLAFAIADLVQRRKRALPESVAVQLVLAGLVGFAIVLLAAPALLDRVIAYAMDVPLWAESEFSPRTYYWMFANTIPLVLSLTPLIYLVVARRDRWFAAYLFLWFAVPLVLHSFVLKFQAERYVILALPGLFLAAGIAAADGCGALFRRVAVEAQRVDARISQRAAQVVAVCAVAAVVAIAVFTTPAFSRSTRVALRQLDVRSPTDYRRALEVLRSTPGADTLPWGSLQHLTARYYWPRVDFTIERGLLDRPVGGPETPGTREIVVHPEGTRDFYLGIPVLWRASAVREYFGTGRDVIVAIDSTAEANYPGGVVAELRRGGARELCLGRCGTVQLYRWTLADDTTDGNR